MRIAAVSASAAVLRALEAVICESGHELALLPEAELVIRDTLHPTEIASPLPELLLARSEGPNRLGCPLSPAQLARQLAARSTVRALRLGHGWELDIPARSLVHPALPATPLTEKESALLAMLVGTRPTAIGREQLLADVWGITSDIDTHTLETHIYRLRHKLSELSPSPCDIVTEEGAYRVTGIDA